MPDKDEFKKNIHDDYDIEEELGSGQFAVVRKIVEKETGDEYAAKYVRKKRTKASRNGMSREDIKREIEILRMVEHEKIIRVHDVYETDKEMILVMELLRGGELFDYISKKDFLTEEEAIDFTRQILQGLQHLHSQNIVHLDLKPENILLKNTRKKTIKLVDFGLARVVQKNEQVREIMGTPEFVAPEVLNFDTISTATDMWALGVIAYILLSGASPFLGEDNQETFTNIIQVDYQFDEEYFSEISDEAKDFIRKLLVKNPRKRPSAHECSRHTWVEEEVVDKKKKQRRRTTQICTFNFKRFVARKRWKMSYNKIRAMNLIAKMGIKPPLGFITVIPPMSEKSEEVIEPEVFEEKPKEHKKKESTIHRKKNKCHPVKASATEDNESSLSLKTMDIDIGERVETEPGTEPDNEVTEEVEMRPAVDYPAVNNPTVDYPAVDYPAVDYPVNYGSMSRREKRRARGQLRTDEIAKSKKEIDAKQAEGESNDTSETHVDVTAEPAVEKAAESKSNVTSTMHIEQKVNVTTSCSGGILKKTKATRIPSTEDHFMVTLNAALLQQEESYYPSGSRQHGILKHTSSSVPDDGPKNNEDVSKPLENKKVSQFTAVVQVNNNNDSVVVVAKDNEQNDKNKTKPPSKDQTSKISQGSRESPTPRPVAPATKKPGGKTEMRTFSPSPWQRRPSRENIKVSPSLTGLSNVSLKTNRFLTNDKQQGGFKSSSCSNINNMMTTNKSKKFQSNGEKESVKKSAVNKESTNEELKNVSCGINMVDDRDVMVTKQRDVSGSDNESRDTRALNVESDSKPGSFSRSISAQEVGSSHQLKISNGERSQSSGEIFSSSAVNVVLNEVQVEEKEDLKCLSTHSLTEFTIKPRVNTTGDNKPREFDIVLTVAPPSEHASRDTTRDESRVGSTMINRFTSSSSSLPDPRLGVPNGKLTSLSTNDVTTAERHGVAAQAGKYTPQRDFTKYLNNDSSKASGNSSNNQKPSWMVKRTNPPSSMNAPTKTFVPPASRPSPGTGVTTPAKFSISMSKGKKSGVTTTAYIPTRSFGFTKKAATQSEVVVKPSEPNDPPKLNNNDDSKRWSQSSYTSDRSGSSASSDEMSLSNITADNNTLNLTGSVDKLPQKTENHSVSARDSPVPPTKWKATLVLPDESAKIPSSRNAPRKKNFTNVRSMWEGK